MLIGSITLNGDAMRIKRYLLVVVLMLSPTNGYSQNKLQRAVMELPSVDQWTIDPANVEKECTSLLSTNQNLEKSVRVRALKRRGVVLIDQGKPEQARADFETALTLTPGDWEAELGIVVALGSLGKTEDAIKRCNELIKRTPNCKEAYAVLAAIYCLLGRYQVAVELSDVAINIDASYAKPYLIRATANFHLDQFKKALKSVDRFLELCPLGGASTDDWPYALRGAILLSIGGCSCCEQAAQSFLMARRLNNSSAEAIWGLWASYRNAKKPNLASYVASEAIRMYPKDSQWHVRSAMSLIELDELAAALITAQKAVKLGENNADAHLILAYCYMQNGEYENALRHCNRALDIDPKNEHSILLTAYIYATVPTDTLRDGRRSIRLLQSISNRDIRESPIGYMILAMSRAELHQSAEAQQALVSLSKINGLSEKMTGVVTLLTNIIQEGKPCIHDRMKKFCFPFPEDRLDQWGKSHQ